MIALGGKAAIEDVQHIGTLVFERDIDEFSVQFLCADVFGLI